MKQTSNWQFRSVYDYKDSSNLDCSHHWFESIFAHFSWRWGYISIIMTVREEGPHQPHIENYVSVLFTGAKSSSVGAVFRFTP